MTSGMLSFAVQRRLPCGVEIQKNGQVHVRVWAPASRRLDVVDAGDHRRRWPLIVEGGGYHTALLPEGASLERYWFALDGERLRPDPCSRWQPEGPHGPSAIVDPAAFNWTDEGWRGISRDGQVLYEMHVG